MTRSEIEIAVTTFIVEELLEGSGDGFDAATPLLELGIIDSLTIVALLSFLEADCGVAIPSEKVRPESFKDVASIALLATQLERDDHGHRIS